MNTILVMNLTGTSMILSYLFLKKTLRGKLAETTLYGILRAAVLAFLCPLHLLGKIYKWAVLSFFHLPLTKNHYTENDLILLTTKGGNAFASYGLRIEIYIVAVYFVCAVGTSFYWLIRDWKKRKVLKGVILSETTQNIPMLEDLCKKYRLRRKIVCHVCEKSMAAATMGIIKPVILCKMPEEQLEQELLLTHELFHIKRHDILWLVLLDLIKGLNFWNPFVYYLSAEFRTVSEQSCDECVIRSLDNSGRAVYAEMLVDYSGFGFPTGERLTTPFGEKKGVKKSNLKERIKKIIKYEEKSVLKRAAGIILASVMLLFCSFSVLAYENIYSYEISDDSEGSWITGREIHVLVGDISPLEYVEQPLLYPSQYTDSSGNIYPLEDITEYAYDEMLCQAHNYEEITIARHQMNDNGGCTIIYSTALKCTRCGKITDEAFLREVSQRPCPHNF